MTDTATTSEQTDADTRGLLDRLRKALGSEPRAEDQLADQLAKMIDEHGDDAVKSLVVGAYADEIAATPVAKAAPDGDSATITVLSAKIDALIKVVTEAFAEDTSEDSSEDVAKQLAKALGVTPDQLAKALGAKTDDKPSTGSQSAGVRDALVKAGVPAPLVETALPALESSDPKAAESARAMLAKLAGTVDISKLLKENGTQQSTDPTPDELSEADKAAVAAMVAGL